MEEEPAVIPPAVSQNTVLIVDDDPAAQDLLQRSLQKEGFQTVIAGNGQQALALARAVRWHCEHRVLPDQSSTVVFR